LLILTIALLDTFTKRAKANGFMDDIDTSFRFSENTGLWERIDMVPFPNRAMNFGDGSFETMVFKYQSIRFFDRHLDRLERGMKILGFDKDFISAKSIEDFCKDNFSGKEKRIRWTIYRKGAGKYTPKTSEYEQILQVSDFQPASKVKKLAGFSERITLYPYPWSSVKTLNSLPYIIANQERVARGLDEILLLDSRGFLSEGGSSNLFWRTGQKWFTPALSCACLAGISRSVIIEKFKKEGISIEETESKPEVLAEANQVMVCNSTGISFLEQINGMSYQTEFADHLKNIFE